MMATMANIPAVQTAILIRMFLAASRNIRRIDHNVQDPKSAKQTASVSENDSETFCIV